MINQSIVLPYRIHLFALDLALRSALPGKFSGASTYMVAPPDVFLTNTFTEADQPTLDATVAAHDPVFITLSKTAIRADGLDSVTVTVTAPKPGAAAVILLVTSSAGVTEWPFTLVNGAASDTLTALDPDLLTLSLKTPANRSTDSLTITAV